MTLYIFRSLCLISLSLQKLQDLCAALDEFALPRAIVNFEQSSFVAWNPKFLEQTGYSQEEIKIIQLEEVLTVGESWSPLPDDTDSQKAEYAGCAVKKSLGEPPVPGFIVRTHSKIGYLMLDVFNSSSVQFEQGRLFGREEELNRINKAFHDEVSSSIVAALFLIETAKGELEQAGLPQAEMVERASDILTETTEKISEVLTPAENSGPKS